MSAPPVPARPSNVRARRAARLLALLFAAPLALACASTPYHFNEHGETELTLRPQEGESQFVRGRPNRWVDGFGHYFFSLPSKLILLHWNVNDHRVPPEAEEALRQYLHANGLCNTKVRLNQYDPAGEWRRLVRNREMPAGWRYSIGVLSVAFYTIFPDRLFAGFPFIGGGDHYNPYTNTVSVYSSNRPVLLHEGGHAKDFAGIENRHWRGVYAGLRAFPFVGLVVALWQEAVASSDALSWELATAGSRESRAAYRILYPAYGTYVGGTSRAVASFFVDKWILLAIQGGAIVAGHVAGQTRALFVAQRDAGIEPGVIHGPPPTAGEPPSIDAERAPPPRAPCSELESVPEAESEPGPWPDYDEPIEPL